MYPGAYLGGGPLGHGPPFGSLGLQNCIVKWAKLRHGPPPFVSWASGFRLEIWVSSGEKRNGPWVKTFFFFCSSPKFGRKMGRNLSEDLFFLCSSPKFGRKMRLNLSGTTSDSDLCSSQIFWNFWPPPFSKSCVRYCMNRTLFTCNCVFQMWIFLLFACTGTWVTWLTDFEL